MRMAKVNKDVLIGLLAWTGYNEVLATIASIWTGWNWWYFQPFVIIMSVLMVALTFGSQTKPDRNWYEND